MSRSPASISRPRRNSAGCWGSSRARGAASCSPRTTWTRGWSSRPISPFSCAGASCTSPRAAYAPRGRLARPTDRPSGTAMGDVLRHAWVIARKDLLLEFRSRTAFVSATVFAALVLTVFEFGRDPTAVKTSDLAPSILWVTFTFAGMLALNRAFQLELENQALDALLVAPISRTSLYWAKLLANCIFVGVVEAIGLPLFVLFFDVP